MQTALENLEGTGIDPAALARYVTQQIYSLPGTDRHRDFFSVLLTGSRATGTHGPNSDVDIDVLCPQEVYDSVHAASLAAGIIKGPRSFFCILPDEDWYRYYGADWGRPHFSLNPLEQAERQIAACEDVPLWIWTHARILADPDDRFRGIVKRFDGYPKPVLIKKIKYRWMMAAYWEVECYPHHASSKNEMLPAATAVLNAVNELLRFFFLVEGRPFPYAEKLIQFAASTKLGARFCPMLGHVVNLAVGGEGDSSTPWDRLDRASALLTDSDEGEELERACGQAMIDAGVDPQWVEADFKNIEELRSGQLGPLP